jgi:hypothetical protein
MFDLSLSDHLRLTFGHIVYRQKAHSEIARSRARLNRVLRGAEALLLLGVVATSLAAASGRGSADNLASAALGGLALATVLLHLTFNDEASIRAHASCATRLWLVRERYHALMSDMSDGAIDSAMARQRREELIGELQKILEDAPPVDRHAHAIAEADERALTDEQIDVFLPKSLHKAGTAATT